MGAAAESVSLPHSLLKKRSRQRSHLDEFTLLSIFHLYAEDVTLFAAVVSRTIRADISADARSEKKMFTSCSWLFLS